jgi:hypothetical protein
LLRFKTVGPPAQSGGLFSASFSLTFVLCVRSSLKRCRCCLGFIGTAEAGMQAAGDAAGDVRFASLLDAVDTLLG